MNRLIADAILALFLALALQAYGATPERPSYSLSEYITSAGEAVAYLAELKKEGVLPGANKDEYGKAELATSLPRNSPELPTFNYPLQLEITFKKDTEKGSVYKYLLNKLDHDAPWVLIKVFKEDQTGTVIDDNLSVPSEDLQKVIYDNSKKSRN